MASETGEKGGRPDEVSGRIIIVRHGKPNLDREAGPRLTWREYREWWAKYEKAPLAEGQDPPLKLLDAAQHAPFLFASIRPRAVETAQKIAGDREVHTDPVFVEAPLPPPHWENKRYLPKTWNKIARLSWLWGHHDIDESREQAETRAELAADKLVEASMAGEDVVLAAHGWFNRMLRPALKKRGWRCRRDGGDGYWSFRIYEKTS